jgi:hypothetical protein
MVKRVKNIKVEKIVRTLPCGKTIAKHPNEIWGWIRLHTSRCHVCKEIGVSRNVEIDGSVEFY